MALPSSRLRTTVSVESTMKDGSMKKLIFHNIPNFTRIEKLKIVLFVRLMEQETVDCFCGWCWGEQARWINRCDQSSNEKYELKSGFGNLIVESLLLFCKFALLARWPARNVTQKMTHIVRGEVCKCVVYCARRARLSYIRNWRHGALFSKRYMYRAAHFFRANWFSATLFIPQHYCYRHISFA